MKKILEISIAIILAVLFPNCAGRHSVEDIPDNGNWVRIGCNYESVGPYLRDDDLFFVMLEGKTQINEADAETFRVCADSYYAKDINYVYYPSIILIANRTIDHITYYFLDGADAGTFKYIGNGYAVDKNNMYHDGKIIKWNHHILDSLVNYSEKRDWK